MLISFIKTHKEELFRLLFYIVVFISAVYFFPILTERVKDRLVEKKLESNRMAALADFLPRNHVNPVIVDGSQQIIDRNKYLNGDFRIFEQEGFKIRPENNKLKLDVEEMYNRYKKDWTREMEEQGMIKWYMHHLNTDTDQG